MTKKETHESKWSAQWNPSNPIEELFDCLEECYVIAIVALLQYTMKQMTDKDLATVQQTGPYKLFILKWNGFNAGQKTYMNGSLGQ